MCSQCKANTKNNNLNIFFKILCKYQRNYSNKYIKEITGIVWQVLHSSSRKWCPQQHTSTYHTSKKKFNVCREKKSHWKLFLTLWHLFWLSCYKIVHSVVYIKCMIVQSGLSLVDFHTIACLLAFISLDCLFFRFKIKFSPAFREFSTLMFPLPEFDFRLGAKSMH